MRNSQEWVPHSYLLGHLIETGKIMARFLRDMYPLCIATLVLQKYPHLEKYGFIVLDAWPFVLPMIYVFDPDMSSQFTQVHSLPKSDDLKSEFRPLTQNKDLVTLDGQAWKFWRSVFNPGFSVKNLISLTPAFLEEIRLFSDRLRAAAKSGEVLKLEEHAVNLTIDVIGRSILGTRLHCQTRPNPLQWALAKQISWLIPEHTPPSLLKLINPARPLLMWNYNRIIRNYLLPIIQEKVAAQAHGDFSGSTETKTVLSLAAKAYLAEKPQAATTSRSAPVIDEEFISMTIPQLVIFLFAGHDTTATTLCFAYNLLNKNPSTLAALRAEHDAVLGPNPADAESRIAANPQLLNALPYTAAVIKETLRLYPPAATVRQGQPSFELVHPATGRRFATAGFVVHQNSHATHHLPAVFPRPTEFLPERFLAAEGEPLHVRRNAFRAFELGPRGCIGQELAQLELRMILALTAREFDLEMVVPDGLPEVFREQGTYPVGNVTGHPFAGMPVRVKIRG
ncbi:uncharacterized protein THITE_2114777 [Thermothielavioides terrestris NRRL 8126]|uniref:Cytochrome P450 n=1 Tax=Thermothielavioides terrestris (strain ATCC 38088 / NRRL 8126) TaxID=578455 RepID=G2R1Q1_THETT|nr:uncharacterized protein THITE_2114777 [Thermothielavioides terrestris NRRL 8126]AEO66593.1 hypothetical protein THITE_2114777 [Thermothielavioides terrestris NRRL 8126]